LGFKSASDASTQSETTTAARLKDFLRLSANKHPGIANYNHLCELSETFSRQSSQYEQLRKKDPGSNAHDDLLISILNTSALIRKHHRPHFNDLFTKLSTTEMDDGVKGSLTARLDHLGQYEPTAARLLKHAKRLSCFRSVEVRGVYTAPLDLTPFLASKATAGTGLLNRFIGQSQELRGLDVKAAMNALIIREKKSLAMWQKEIRNGMEKGQHGGYKVHAEIQLLLDYEHKQEVVYPPRILKSSKDACFLCDLFIKTHGKYHIPQTHGKVYGLWMLPDLGHLGLAQSCTVSRVIEEFSKAVEDLLLNAIAEGMPRRADPRESGIFSLASSNTQVCTASERPWSKHTSWRRSNTDDEVSMTIGTSEAITVTPHTSFLSEPGIVHLRPGASSAHTVKPGDAAIRLHTRRIHVELSYLEGFHMASQSSSQLRHEGAQVIRIEATWLTSGQVPEALQRCNEAIVNLGPEWETLQAKHGIMFAQSGLLIQRREEVLQLRASHVENDGE
jgi:hypothetical protein